jgi:hypothetical protein
LRWITLRIKWIMLAAGALTCTMVVAAISPRAALLRTFGQALEGPVAEIVVRNWGALVTLVGVMLIYGAFDPASRRLVLVVAGLSKLVFIGLVLVHGTQFLGRAGVALAVDAVMIGLFAVYLVGARKEAPRARRAAVRG